MRVITALFFLFCFLVPSALAQFRDGFYANSCPQAEAIVATVVAFHFGRDPSITAALLRMQFQDCFVRGCDASLLIDPTSERPSEKNATRNASERGYEIIDDAKKLLERECFKTVSCADIVILATRDAVALAGGPTFVVPTGRRDGLRSSPIDVNLPGPEISVAAAIRFFATRGMNKNDMVTLIGGGHSVGVAHCSQFQDRLNDPSMDRELNARLRNKCRAPNDPSVFLDQKTPFRVDSAIYGEIRRQRGILRIDQNLWLDRSTQVIVSNFALSSKLFRERFAQAMVKMGTTSVLTGRAGEIRENCRKFNN